MATKELPLWHKLYFCPEFTAVARMVGYAGMVYCDFAAGLQNLIEQHGRKAEWAASQLVTYEGQWTTNPKPLAQVTLRSDVRKLCFQLLGPEPGTPEHAHFHTDGKREEPKPQPKSRKKKAG